MLELVGIFGATLLAPASVCAVAGAAALGLSTFAAMSVVGDNYPSIKRHLDSGVAAATLAGAALGGLVGLVASALLLPITLVLAVANVVFAMLRA
ncbi:MAG TPA: hypothetical protein VKD22_01945 [Ramlibacter sp.]|nr:hypothetical protein [Ramlibacter sp.]